MRTPAVVADVVLIMQSQAGDYRLEMVEEAYLLLWVITFNLYKSLGIPMTKVLFIVSSACSLDLINFIHILLLKVHVLSVNDMVIS